MQTSTVTSDLLKMRVKLVEEKRLEEMQSYISAKDFNKVGKLAIQESNSLHAVCLDTYPPLFYLNEKSKEIIRIINEFNKFEQTSTDSLKAFYSFDAGPNAFLFVLDEHRTELLYLIYKLYFSEIISEEEYSEMLKSKGDKYFTFSSLSLERRNLIDAHFVPIIHFKSTKKDSLIKYVISSKAGKDPTVLYNDWSNSLFGKDWQVS